MTDHVRILGILHVVYGMFGILAGIIVMLIFGGLAGLVSVADRSGDALIAVPILGGIGAFVFVLLLVLSPRVFRFARNLLVQAYGSTHVGMARARGIGHGNRGRRYGLRKRHRIDDCDFSNLCQCCDSRDGPLWL